MKTDIAPEPALLGFLLARPLHGYNLYQRVKKELGPIWHLGRSQMYAILSSFERQGWIETRMESQKTHPARKMLELTPAGRQVFNAWLRETAHGMRELRIAFFLRLYFARQVGAGEARKLIDRQIKGVRDELALLQKEKAATTREDNGFHRLAWDFRIHQLSTVLRWLDVHRAELERKAIGATTSPTLESELRTSATGRSKRPRKNRREYLA